MNDMSKLIKHVREAPKICYSSSVFSCTYCLVSASPWLSHIHLKSTPVFVIRPLVIFVHYIVP